MEADHPRSARTCHGTGWVCQTDQAVELATTDWLLRTSQTFQLWITFIEADYMSHTVADRRWPWLGRGPNTSAALPRCIQSWCGIAPTGHFTPAGRAWRHSVDRDMMIRRFEYRRDVYKRLEGPYAGQESVSCGDPTSQRCVMRSCSRSGLSSVGRQRARFTQLA